MSSDQSQESPGNLPHEQGDSPRNPLRNMTQTELERHLRSHFFERLLYSSKFMRELITLGGHVALSAMIWPRWFAPYRLKIRRVPMVLRGLHPDMRGYRLLFMCDFHCGSARQDYLRQSVQKALALKPDAIVIGGDLIDYSRKAISDVTELLGMMHAPGGVYTIFGNHDYYEYSSKRVGERSHRRAIHRRLIKLVQQSPVRLLRNEMITLRRGQGAIQLVGMDELWSGRADPDLAFGKVDPAVPVVCLQHNPDGCAVLQKYPWDYMLCGHSHGGQVRFPLIGALHAPLMHREWIMGFFDIPGGRNGLRTLFVSTGVGHSQPLRLLCPPEMVLFELTDQEPKAEGK